ncbi:RluA family pseudouridine synthase [bacterium]|nr:RluA family pseudouridine synthase [bacterium]
MKKPTPIAIFVVQVHEAQNRLDKVLRAHYPAWGRQAVSKLLQNRQVRVNGKPVWMGSWKVSAGDRVEVANPPKEKPPVILQFDPAWLVADEGDLLVVSKPAGLLSQAVRKGGRDNLLSLVQQAYGADVRLFHRLDRDTSGLTILTRPGPVNAYLDRAFKERLVLKEYVAVVENAGKLEDQGELRDYLDRHPHRRDMMQVVERGGKYAHTRYRTGEETPLGVRIRLWPETGRTHQLRVQLAYRRAPIIGDRLYGGKPHARLLLHAERLVLPEMEDFPVREWVSKVKF